MQNKFELLCTEKIIRILIGDNADDDSEVYRLGMPYLRGQDICSLATQFGFAIVYKEGDLGWKSRLDMFKAFLLDSIKRNTVSNVLAHMFSLERFNYLTDLENSKQIQEAHKKAISWTLEKINANLFLGQHELKCVNGKFLIAALQNGRQVEAPTINFINMDYIHGLTERCKKDLSNGDYDSVITKSRTLMEEVFLYIIEKKEISIKMNGDVTQYYGAVKDELGLNQGKEIDTRLNSLFGGLEKIVRAVAELRNKNSDSHGAGRNRYAIRDYEARMVMNSAITICEYILSIYLNP